MLRNHIKDFAFRILLSMVVFSQHGLVPNVHSSPHNDRQNSTFGNSQTFRPTTSMKFTEVTELELLAAFDAHVHLRDGEMSQLVTPTIRKGGVNQVYVMVS